MKDNLIEFRCGAIGDEVIHRGGCGLPAFFLVSWPDDPRYWWKAHLHDSDGYHRDLEDPRCASCGESIDLAELIRQMTPQGGPE